MKSSWIIIVAISTVLVASALLLRRNRNASVNESVAKTKPASSSAKTPVGEKNKASSLFRKIMEGGEAPQLTPEQLRAFVEKHKHSASSLLAAWQLGHDTAWLDEAVQRYPDQPRVALAKLSTFKQLDGEAKEWIERLKQNDPQNSVGWCYDALSEFKNGSPDAARAALAEAAKRSRFDGYSKESAPMLADAYRSTGIDPLASELLGGFSVALPQLPTGMNVVREAIAKLGPDLDDATVQDILALAKTVRSADGSGYLITDLVSSAMERKALDELSVLDLVPGTKKFVAERTFELDAEKTQIKEFVAKAQPLLLTLGDSEMKQYFKRVTVEGELKAMKWLLARHPEVK